jgi:hypothetical protein
VISRQQCATELVGSTRVRENPFAGQMNAFACEDQAFAADFLGQQDRDFARLLFGMRYLEA